MDPKKNSEAVSVFVRLLKTVQGDLIALNVHPEKALEIWSIGVETYREFIAGRNTSVFTVSPGEGKGGDNASG